MYLRGEIKHVLDSGHPTLPMRPIGLNTSGVLLFTGAVKNVNLNVICPQVCFENSSFIKPCLFFFCQIPIKKTTTEQPVNDVSHLVRRKVRKVHNQKM